MLTILADYNIAYVQDYFCAEVLGLPVRLVKMAGRDITRMIVNEYQPDAILIRSVTTVDARLLSDNTSVRFVGSATIGTDHVDVDYLCNREIIFANASGCSKHSVAQYVLTAILQQRPVYWNASDKQPVTLGIVGLGNIGSTLATYADDLSWNVLGYDPFLPASNLNNASFEQVLSQSDVISLHVPLTTPTQSPHPTQHLVDAHAFAQMAETTMLVNTARGAVVREADLLTDMAHHRRDVVLDVFEHEPTVSQQVLKTLAIATPHIAGYTLEGKLRGTQMIFEAFVQTFANHLTLHHPPTLQSLLPPNSYQWQDLLNNPKKLAMFYDIKSDDALLRGAVNLPNNQVEGKSFDGLRKRYRLRREWRRDAS